MYTVDDAWESHINSEIERRAHYEWAIERYLADCVDYDSEDERAMIDFFVDECVWGDKI